MKQKPRRKSRDLVNKPVREGKTSVSPYSLEPHAKNIVIYGENEDISELIKMIQDSGWIKPLVVTKNGTIISGHRRWLAAKQLNWETIPIEVKEFNSEEEEIEFLLLENATRIKTIEQRIREGKIWEQIEKKKAKERQKMGAISTNNKLGRNTEPTVVANLPQPLKKEKRSRDKVATLVGMKSRNYGKASKVVDLIDSLQFDGKKEKAKRLRQLLNEKSVDSAYRLMKVPSCQQDLILGLNDSSNSNSDLSSTIQFKLAHHLQLDYGVVVEIYQPNNQEIHAKLGRVAKVFETTVDIWRRDMKNMEMNLYRVHHHQARVVNLDEHEDITALNERIVKLRNTPLDPIDRDILELLGRAIALTPKEEKYLTMLEEEYLTL